MNLFVLGIFDSGVQAYGRPIFAPARGAAVRSFTDEVNRVAEDNTLNKHRGDFELRLLAIFDDGAGTFIQVSPPEVLIRGKDVPS